MANPKNTRLIPIAQGKLFAIVDAEDFEFLNQWKWKSRKRGDTFYAIRTPKINGKHLGIFMHRLINKTPKGFDTDHIDGNGLNNTRKNLRTATRAQNMHNCQMRKKKVSKYKGVYFYKRDKVWIAQIKVNKKGIYLGRFSKEKDAAKAYRERAKIEFGEFARFE